MLGWFEWIDIKENPNYEGCGVYKIRLVNSKGFPIEIPRFFGRDKDGIVQIGHSENIKKRIKFFRGAIEGKAYTSTEGKRLYIINKYTNFKETYNNFKIQYSFKKLLNKMEAKSERERLLKLYFERYGEVPPVNNNLPDKYIDWESLNFA